MTDELYAELKARLLDDPDFRLNVQRSVLSGGPWKTKQPLLSSFNDYYRPGLGKLDKEYVVAFVTRGKAVWRAVSADIQYNLLKAEIAAKKVVP